MTNPCAVFTHHFMSQGARLSHVGISIYRLKAAVLVIVDEGSGMSPTNAAEQIATEVYSQHLADVPFSDVIWIERYPYARVRGTSTPNMDLQLHDWQENRSVSVSWRAVATALTQGDFDTHLEIKKLARTLLQNESRRLSDEYDLGATTLDL